MIGVFLGGLIALALMLAIGWVFSKADTGKLAQGSRAVLGLGAIVLGALLTLRGLGVVGAPLAAAGLGLLATMAKRAGGGRADEAPPGRARTRASMSPAEAREILGVDANADPDEIRTAYREMMKRVHPDAGGSNALAAKVREAYEILGGR